MILRGLLLLAALWSASAQATQYYIDTSCSLNGNGQAPGCAASGGGAGAYNTMPTVADGNTYSFKGGVTYNGSVFVGASGSTGVTLNSYGTGRGKISVVRTVQGATTAANWIRESANVWKLPMIASGNTCDYSFGCNPYRLFADGSELCGTDRQTNGGTTPSYLGATTGCLNRWYFAADTTAATITVTIASPAVVTWANHGLPYNSPIVFTTTGALPTGITAGTTYYVRNDANYGTNTFAISASKGGAAVNTTGSQSGTHTGTRNEGMLYWWSPDDSNPTTQFSILKGSQSYFSVQPNGSGGITLFGTSSGNLPPVVIDNLEVEGGNTGSIVLYGSNAPSVEIKNSVIGKYARQGVYLRYQSTAAGTQNNNVSIHDNTIDSGLSESFPANWSYETNFATAHGIAIYDDASNISVYRNTLRDWTHSGLYVYRNTHGTAHDITFYENRIYAGSNCNYCRAFSVDATALNQVYNITFARNYSDGQTARSQINGGPNIYFVSNVMTNGREKNVVHAGENIDREIAQALWTQAYAGNVNAVWYVNNTISDFDSACMMIFADTHGNATNIHLRNNLLLNCGKAGTYTGAIFIHKNALADSYLQNLDVQNNLAWAPGINAQIAYRSVTYSGISASPSLVSGDTWSGNLEADPLITGGREADAFRLRPGSPAIRAGKCYLATGCVHPDYLGHRARVPPNIGAYQQGLSAP